MKFVFFAYATSFVIIINCIPSASDLHQEMTKIEYINPSYIADCYIREDRKNFTAHLTNCTSTLLVPFGNNVTVQVSYKSLTDKNEHITITADVCDILQWKWVKAWVQKFSDIPVDDCPIPPKEYHFYSIQFPPQNRPFSFNEAAYNEVKIKIFVKKTKEKICTVFVILRHETRKNTDNYKPVEVLGPDVQPSPKT